MKAQIIVGGRFHADRKALGLLEAGFEVSVFTSLPPNRFRVLPKQIVHGSYVGEVCSRLLRPLIGNYPAQYVKMEIFAREALFHALQENNSPDLLIGWSSFSLETFKRSQARKKVLVRGSAHFRYQESVLHAEYQKLGIRYRPQKHVLNRELQEYEIADYIVVPSKFAKETFVVEGVNPDKVHYCWLGVEAALFKPRAAREKSGPLRVVFFGNISVQKGIHYLLEATKKFDPKDVEVTLIGGLDRDYISTLSKYHHMKVLPSMSQQKLAEVIKEMDVYVMPTLQDGFAQALIQAMAAGLVPITTPRAGCAEIIKSGKNGYIVPPNDYESIEALLETLKNNRELLHSMQGAAAKMGASRPWQDYQREIATWYKSILRDHEDRSLASKL